MCAQNFLSSDRPRLKLPVIRQVPDHCLDKNALVDHVIPDHVIRAQLQHCALKDDLIRGHFGLETSTWLVQTIKR